MFRHASLNRIYRLVWSESRNAYVAVAENTRARGKRSGTVGSVLCTALGAAAMPFYAGAAAPTTVVPTGGNTAAYISPNGVPVVDINTANAAGVSHNQYLKYNIEKKGLVLNNGNSSQMARQSQLAGQVMANANLANQASLILNEVVAANRSQLSGYTEVLGGKADVVVANPYGITCSGCGFINTDRATLTTGIPVLNGNGALDGFRVTGGDLLINGSGVNASAQQILDLVARSIKIDGQVNANDLSLAAGTNAWNYASRSVTGALAPTDTTPVYAIDSSALGGMYANRIRIVATEAGVGVRMRGDAAASGSDFTLDSSGKITLQNKISAERDLHIASTASGAALTMADNTLTAKRDVDLSATQGAAALNGGVLQANRNLLIDVAALSDAATAAALADNNKRFAGANLHVHANGSVALNGTSYGSGGQLGVDAGSIAVGAAGATLYGNTVELHADNDLALGTAAVQATGALQLTAENGTLSTVAGAAQGIVAVNGSIAIDVDAFDNAGNVSANGNVAIDTDALANAGSISAAKGGLTVRSGAVTNTATGKLHASGDISIADQSGAGGEDIVNAGKVIAGGALDIAADDIANSGTVQAASGTTVAATSLTNSGTWTSSTTANGDTQLNLQQLNNSGTLQSARDLELKVRNTLTNSGKVLATRDLEIEAADAAVALAVANQGNGVLQAGNLLQLRGSNGADNLSLTTQANSLALGKRLELTGASVTNAGILQGKSAGVDIDLGGALNNAGKLISDGALALDADTIVNTGTVQSAQTSTTNANSLNNSGTWLGSTSAGSSASLKLNSLTNSGKLQSEQNLTLTLLDELRNSGTVLAKDNLLIEAAAANTTLTVENQTHGTLQAGNLLQVRGTNGADNVDLLTRADSKVLARKLDVIVASLNNAGVLQGGAGASRLAVTDTLTNSGTITLATSAAGSGTIDANTLINSGMLQSAGATDLNIGSTFTNSGTTLNTGTLKIRGRNASSYTIDNTGRLESTGLLDIRGYGGSDAVDITVGTGGILRGGSIYIDADQLSILGNNSVGGMVNSTGDMDLILNTLLSGGQRSRIVGATASGATRITLQNGFTNYGAIHSGGDLTFITPWFTNAAGSGISSLKTLKLTADGAISNLGAMYAQLLLDLAAGTTFTNGGTLDSSADMEIDADTFINNRDIVAFRNITITARIFQNDVAGDLTRAWGDYTYGADTADGDYVDSDYGIDSCSCNQQFNHYYKNWTRTEYFLYAPSFANKPQILSTGGAGTLTIRQFDSGSNRGGVLSAPTVTLSGNNGSTFLNDDLGLRTEIGRDTWDHLIYWYGVVGAAVTSDRGTVNQAHVIDDTTTDYSRGAGIYATTINATGFTLRNAGNMLAATVDAKSEDGALAGTQGSFATPITPENPVGGGTSATGEPAIGFQGGVTITLPNNPNGYYVMAEDPTADYLVETNPLFAVGSSFVGSNYLAERYGYDPEVVTKRLGDSNYEAYLMRQQLIAQLGTNLRDGYASEADQMKGMMDSAVAEGKRLGFTYGKPLSAAQMANLQEDVVWMVETVVAGKKVLAPVVYLSAATKANYDAGNAVIAGSNVNMKLDALANEGGIIGGRDTLDITAKNDIVNTSGTIKGGNVTLASTEGSIVNQTYASTSGDENDMSTTIGKTASIQSTGDLSIDAARDVTNLGAEMKAGGDASLSAGGNVTFDTIEDKTARTTRSSESNGLTTTNTKTTTRSTEQVKSSLSSGGDLTVKSKNDVTFAGTDVKVGGNAEIDAAGDVNFLARANTNQTLTSTSTSGLGVGGGVAGVETTDTDAFKSRNVGSTLDVGGDAKLKAGNDLTLEGSKVDVGGNADIDVTNVNLLAGKDEDRTTTTTTTTTFLKVDTGSSNNSSGSDSGSGATSGDGAASAEASASAEAANTSSGGIKFAETSTTTTSTYDKTSVGSSINAGGNLKVDAKETVKLVGSEMNAGGDADIKATDVKVLAAQDIHTSSTKTTTTSIGLSAESENKAGARASADAKADSNDMSARANAEASADASSNNTITLASTSTTTSDSLEINNQGSAIRSGGNTSIDASNKITTQGSTLESGGDMNLRAKDIENLAANDVKTTTTTSDTTTMGLYYDGSAEAKAGTTAGGDGIGYTSADASAEASAKAGIEAGYQGKNVKTSNTEGSTTAITSSIKSGGNMTRTATGNITDVGTQIEAGGDFSQSAATIDSKAAENTTFSSSSSDSHTARIGAYAEADASFEAKADSSGEAGAEAGANAGAGLHASYKNEKESSSSSSSTAVVSNIKAGGNINSASTGKTSLEGTNLAAGNDVNLEAGSLDFKAAQDKSNSSTSNSNIDADLKAGINFGSDGKVKGSLGGGYGEQEAADSSTTAVTGSINSGGKLNIKTKDDARFEGTNLDSGGDTNIAAGGNVTFDAAKNTQTSSAEGFDVSAELNLSKAKSGDKKGGLKAEGGYNSSSSDASQAVVSNINSGGKLNVSAGKDATFEGTNIASADDASISAKNNLAFNAARDTSSSESLDVKASLELSGSKGSGKSSSTGGLSAEAEYSKEKSSTAVTGAINSGGNLKLSSGNNTTLEGTQVGADGTVGIDAGGKVDVKAAKSTSESLKVGGAIGGEVEKSKGTDATGKATNETTRSGDLSVDIEGGNSTTSTVASISGGKGIDIKAGSDANFEGTQLKSNGDTNIAAGGNVNLSAAESSEISGGFAGGVSSGTGPKLNKAEIGGGVTNEVAKIDTAGNLNIKSGGKTTLEGTQAVAGDTATIDAKGGVEKKTVVSGGAELGLTKADASLDIQQTSIQSEGRALVPMTDKGFKTSVALPTSIPAGKKVEAATADGKPLPAWLKFDDKTGSFTGTPPADFKGNLNVVVKVPDANGGVSEIPLRFQGQ